VDEEEGMNTLGSLRMTQNLGPYLTSSASVLVTFSAARRLRSGSLLTLGTAVES
jgi:hypothetical protein